jgi:hypothetical protein
MENERKMCELQQVAAQMLLRNKSLLDALTKMQEAGAKTLRSVVKAATRCGCIELSGALQPINSNMTFEEIRGKLNFYKDGEICNECKFAVEKEMGAVLFYMASVCNALDLDMNEIIEKEIERNRLLGGYSLK